MRDIELRKDAPPNGAIESLYVTGGYFAPHAYLTLPALTEDGYLVLRWWEKNLLSHGSVMRSGTGKVLQFKIALKHTKPPVWRRIQVPAEYSFWDFHVALQDAMGWRDYHLHQFEIINPRKRPVEYIGIPDDEFASGQEILPGWKVPIRRLFTTVIRKAAYVYDFGDAWEHTVLLEKTVAREAGVEYPRCIAGRRKCPPEDCGGPWGYHDFLLAMRTES